MNTSHPSTHQYQFNGGSHPIGSSRVPPPPTSIDNEAREARISASNIFRPQNASQNRSPPASLTEDVAGNKGVDTHQVLLVPTKSENCQPRPPLNPASCASGLALIGNGVGSSDWMSVESLTAFIRRLNGGQVNTQRRNSSLQNEDWDDF